MEAVILHKTARTAVIELPGDGLYETEPYEIWVNGTFLRNDTGMILILNALSPGTLYDVCFKRADWGEVSLHFETAEEFVTLNVRSFGAKGDGAADDTGAIQAAVMSCPPKSRVYIPAGTYRIRPLFLKSNLVMELGKGAVLKACQERSDYAFLPGIVQSFDEQSEYNIGSWEGNPLDSMVSILTGIHVENVVICGEGTIDGGADFDNWWIGEPNKYPPYRPRMIFLNGCNNIVIQGIQIKNSPSWNVHPYFSENIRIYGITIESPDCSHNTDGIDPESCRQVDIAGVHFSVGDDCIALKSGKIYMGRTYKQPCEEIWIRHCLMEKGHGAVTIGSEIAGGVRDVTVSSCQFRDTDRGLRIKTRRGRGKDSVIDRITFEHVRMERVKSPFVVNCFYFCDPDGKSDYVACQDSLPADERTPEIKRLSFSDIICTDACHTGICIYGLPEKKVESVVMKDVHITYDPQAEIGTAAMMRECRLTCRQGIYAQNVKELVLEHIQLDGAHQEIECVGVESCIRI